MGEIYNNIGCIYRRMNKIIKAELYVKLAIEIAEYPLKKSEYFINLSAI